jgi:hypothetical protein
LTNNVLFAKISKSFTKGHDLNTPILNTTKQYLSPDDVEELFGISKATQQNLRSLRRVTFTKLAGRVVYLREWWEDYIAANTRFAKLPSNSAKSAHA